MLLQPPRRAPRKDNSSMTVSGGQFKLNGKPFFLYSGEIHYFRMPENLWKTHLKKARKAGLNCVSFYIPWMWHEFEQGRFDFEGNTHPQRNVVKFIRLAREEGLLAAARVGPVSNAELAGEGIPDWVLKGYPEVFVQRSGVNNLPHAILLSYMNPVFQDLVGKWYDKVLPVVASRQVHRGGPVAMVQLCNEIGMIHWLHKTPADPASRPEGQPTEKTIGPFFDWALSCRKYYALYFKSLYDRAKGHGIEVPVSANIPQFYDYDVRGRGVFSPMTTSLFRDFSSEAPGTVFGGAYQLRRVDFENFHDVSVTSEAVKALSRSQDGPVPPVICAELQTGILRDRPRLYPADVGLNILTSAAHGLNGVNCYMFSSGKNLPGMGCFGNYHDWQAPVGLDGEERGHFAPIQKFGAFLKKWGERLSETEKVTDTSLGFYLPYFATEYFSGEWARRVEELRRAYFFDGLSRLIQLAGYNFSLTDLLKETPESLRKKKSLCLFSLDWMDAAAQELLAGYVREGGKLLLGPRIPTLDLTGKPCKVLLESLGLTLKILRDTERAHWQDIEFIPDFPVQAFEGPGRSWVKTESGAACAQSGEAGRGRWFAHGFGLYHNFDYQARMAGSWLKELGIERQAEAEPWDLQAVLRWKKEHGFLFVFNYHDVEKEGAVRVHLSDLKQPPFQKQVSLGKRSGIIIPLRIQGNRILEVK